MSNPSLDEIIRVTARIRGIDITEARINRIVAKARKAKGDAGEIIRVLENEISALERGQLDLLIIKREAELAELRARLQEMDAEMLTRAVMDLPAI